MKAEHSFVKDEQRLNKASIENIIIVKAIGLVLTPQKRGRREAN